MMTLSCFTFVFPFHIAFSYAHIFWIIFRHKQKIIIHKKFIHHSIIIIFITSSSTFMLICISKIIYIFDNEKRVLFGKEQFGEEESVV